jgi:uncharacterized membrane protein
MAGIGFQLRKIMSAQTFGNVLQAYAYAAIISSGPLILSIASLALLGLFIAPMSSREDVLVFFTSVTHIYSFTLILTGPAQLVFSRYASDCLYAGHPNRVFPALVTVLAFGAPFLLLIGWVLFVILVKAPPVFQLTSAFMMPVVGSIWLISAYLTALKNYMRVIISYASGYASGFLLAWVAVRLWGAHCAMLGFALGHVLLLVLLFGLVCSEIGSAPLRPGEILACFRKYHLLAWCGLLYNLGIWADKFIFWWLAPDRMHVNGVLYAMPVYDRAIYLGFLSVIPGMAIFLLSLETNFAAKCELFFKQVVGKATLGELQATRQQMISALVSEVFLLIKVQGAITLLLIILAEDLMPVLQLGALETGVFRVVLLGSLLLVLFLSFLTILFYLDKKADSLISCAIFCGVNALVTLVSVLAGEQWYGLGFDLAVAFALAYAALRVNYHLHRLEYDTFSLQPLYS